MRRLIGIMVASLVGTCVAFATPLTVSAALLWTLTASPLAVGTGISTTFTLTAANMLLGRIECVVVDVPANFSVGTVGVVGSTAGDSWVAARAGNRVTVWTTSGGDRLELLDSVTFTVAATAMSGGSLAWPSAAYDRPDCDGSASLLGIPPVVVVSGPAVTPSPVPTPVPTPILTPVPTLVPTPAPTPARTPVPLPSVPLPVPFPTIGLPGIPDVTPRPEITASPSPRPTAVPEASTTAVPEASTTADRQPAGGSTGPPPPSDGPSGGEARIVDTPTADSRFEAPRVVFDEPDLELGTLTLGTLAAAPVWVVPVATIGGPGLIVLLWVALQAGGASIWIPAARRLRGEERRVAS